MLLLIFIIVFVLGICLCYWGDKLWYKLNIDVWYIGMVTSVFTGLVIAVMIIVIISSNIMADSKVAQNKERYKALIYKVESADYRDEFGILNKSVINEVQAWNEDLASGKELQDDLFVGIFVPDIYEQFEFIDYNRMKWKVEG